MTTAAPALLDTVEFETGPQPAWTVLWLHGLGDSGEGWAPVVPELVRKDWPSVRFVFPHAPVRPVTINNGLRMRAWYDIRDFQDLANRADAEGVEQSVAQVEALIAREAERGVPAARVVLAGFSQGGAITLAAGLCRREPLAGLIALSTYLPLGERLIREAAPAASAQPVFMAHGSHDPVVPFQGGEIAAAGLRSLGFQVEWHTYPMAHQACGEEIEAVADWLGRRFAQA